MICPPSLAYCDDNIQVIQNSQGLYPKLAKSIPTIIRNLIRKPCFLATTISLETCAELRVYEKSR